MWECELCRLIVSPAVLLCGVSTHCLPPVAGSSTYLSKYRRTRRSRSSGPGRAKFTISSIRSFMAQSSCSGWLLANTSMNLQEKQQVRWFGDNRKIVRNRTEQVEKKKGENKNGVYLLLCSPVRYKNAFRVALRSSLIFSCNTQEQRFYSQLKVS